MGGFCEAALVVFAWRTHAPAVVLMADGAGARKGVIAQVGLDQGMVS
jgi:hypothetical protein